MSTNRIAINQPHTSIQAGASSAYPIGTQEAPAHSCYCGVVVATSAAYFDEDGEEYDEVVLYRRCMIHEKDSSGSWFADTLHELMAPTLHLTKDGRALWKELSAEADQTNPYIPRLSAVKAEIKQVEDELAWFTLAKEKTREWNQEDSESRARTGEGVPLPEWLRRYENGEEEWKARKALEAKRKGLDERKFNLETEIVQWRYEYKRSANTK